VFLIYPTALLYIGIQHVYGECAINYMIPVWMLVYGAVGIITVIFGIILALFLILYKKNNNLNNFLINIFKKKYFFKGNLMKQKLLMELFQALSVC